MDGIGKECEQVNQRMAQLSQRLDKVAVETRKFDINAEDPAMMEDPPEVQILSKVNQTSQLLTPESRPAAVQERYDKAEPPPKVHILQHVRDADPNDEKACIQMYSDPSYFYQQWKNDMDAMTEIEQKKKEDDRKEKEASLCAKPETLRLLMLTRFPLFRNSTKIKKWRMIKMTLQPHLQASLQQQDHLHLYHLLVTLLLHPH